MRHFVLIAALLATAATSPASAAALLPNAGIGPGAARHTAVACRPGPIKEEELSKGSTGLRNSFGLPGHGRMDEVGVDARTAAVVESDVEAEAD